MSLLHHKAVFGLGLTVSVSDSVLDVVLPLLNDLMPRSAHLMSHLLLDFLARLCVHYVVPYCAHLVPLAYNTCKPNQALVGCNAGSVHVWVGV